MFKNKISPFSKISIIKLFSLLALVLIAITGILYFSNSNYLNIAKASVVCPAGSTSNGSQCISNTPSGYSCPAGYTLQGNQCSQQSGYSCPSGGLLQGTTCVATITNPIQAPSSCGNTNTGNIVDILVSSGGVEYCYFHVKVSSDTQPIYNTNTTCDLAFDPNLLGAFGTQIISPMHGGGGAYFTDKYVGVPNVTFCIGRGYYSFNGNVYIITLYRKNWWVGTYTYTGTPQTSVIAATPLYTTVVNSLVSPLALSSGQISFTCGDNNTVIISSSSSYSPDSVPTTTCTGSLPSQMILDANNPLTLKIGNIGENDIVNNSFDLTGSNSLESTNCTIGAVGSGAGGATPFTCGNVPVGSLTGSQEIQFKLGTNSTVSGYGEFLNSTSFINVYSDEVFSDGEIDFLKGITGTTSAYNNVLHKDWRTGVTGNETRISLNNFKSYRDIQPSTPGRYICRIGVRPSGSSGNFINLINDADGNGSIESTEISATTATDIPYNTVANSCSALFTNVNFVTDNTPPNNDPTTMTVSPNGGGQPSITTNLAKTYNWEVKVDVLDTSINGNPTVATFNSGVGFKFAAIIPGG